MAYIKQVWDDYTWGKGQRHLQNQLNHMEDGIVAAGSGSVQVSCIELSGTSGTLTADQATILKTSEINYIWYDGKYRLDYRQKTSGVSAYSFSEGVETHTISVNDTTGAWTYSHTKLQQEIPQYVKTATVSTEKTKLTFANGGVTNEDTVFEPIVGTASGDNWTSLKIGDVTKNIPSGGSGTSDYNSLTNKPKINSVELSGDKTASDLGLQAESKWIELAGWADDNKWHDGGTITADQATILTASELNYIWMNGMHRLDFRYKDTANNLATYSSNDGEKCHVIEIKLSDKSWRYKHQLLQTKLTAGTNITIDETTNTISATGGGASYTAGNGIDISSNTISTKLGKGLEHTDDGKITIQVADTTIVVGEFGAHVPYVSTSLDNTSSGLAVKLADNSIEAYDSGTGTKGIRVNQNEIQHKLTAGTGISIDDTTNTISATGSAGITDFKINGTSKVTSGVAELNVMNNFTVTPTEFDALGATIGKEISDKVDKLEQNGRFLSTWNAKTGKPDTDPSTMPYNYHRGDYYRVSEVGGGRYIHQISMLGTTTASDGYSAEFGFIDDDKTAYTSFTSIAKKLYALGYKRAIDAVECKYTIGSTTRSSNGFVYSTSEDGTELVFVYDDGTYTEDGRATAASKANDMVATAYVHDVNIEGTSTSSQPTYVDHLSFPSTQSTAYSNVADIAHVLKKLNYSEVYPCFCGGQVGSTSIYLCYGDDDVLVLMDNIRSEVGRLATASSLTDTTTKPGIPNYRPDGTQYTGVASTVEESEELNVGATYYYDGAKWVLQNNISKSDGKTWKTISLKQSDVEKLDKGGSFVQVNSDAYDDSNFYADYFKVTLDSTPTSEGNLIYAGTEDEAKMEKLYIDFGHKDDLGEALPYFRKLVNYGMQYSFDYNYYQTIVLWAGTERGRKEVEGPNAIAANNVIYLQDVSQQSWEQNPIEGTLSVNPGAREELGHDTYDLSYVISIKDGDGNVHAYLIALEDTQAAYWDETATTKDKTRWANVYANKVYKVTFDPSTGHGTLRWLLTETPVTDVKGKKGVELTAAELATLYTTPITFMYNETEYAYSSVILIDTTLGAKCECLGNGAKETNAIFSWNTTFDETPAERLLEFIGRPTAIVNSTYGWEEYDGTSWDKYVSKSGFYMWSVIIDNAEFRLIIPKDSVYRNRYIISANDAQSFSSIDLLRHTITIKTPSYIDIDPAVNTPQGDAQAYHNYAMNLSFSAINAQWGEDSLYYVLYSDGNYQEVNWVLPATGVIGKVEAEGLGRIVKTWYPTLRIMGGQQYVSTGDYYVPFLAVEYIDTTQANPADMIQKVRVIDANNWWVYTGRDFRSLIGSPVVYDY